MKDETDKLRAALIEIANMQDCLYKHDAQIMRDIAREALKK